VSLSSSHKLPGIGAAPPRNPHPREKEMILFTYYRVHYSFNSFLNGVERKKSLSISNRNSNFLKFIAPAPTLECLRLLSREGKKGERHLILLILIKKKSEASLSTVTGRFEKTHPCPSNREKRMIVHFESLTKKKKGIREQYAVCKTRLIELLQLWGSGGEGERLNQLFYKSGESCAVFIDGRKEEIRTSSV